MIHTPSSTLDARARFRIDPFTPASVELARRGELEARAAAALRELRDCCACPRECHVDRTSGRASVCKTGRHARVASAAPHFGEEDCLRGSHGSGTIFFGACNLLCVFCQNFDISQRAAGEELPAHRIADLMLALQERGCHNINLVTPEHVVPQVVEAIAVAVAGGLALPIVYNTSAYDAVSSLRLLDGIVDIYMPDFKFWRPETGWRLAKVRDYPERARQAIAEMQRQVGPLRFGPDGLARRGLLVRHLVMPGLEDETAAICRWLGTELGPDTYINLMAQYRPAHQVGKLDRKGRVQYAEIGRTPEPAEVDRAYAAARAAGLCRFDARQEEGIP